MNTRHKLSYYLLYFNLKLTFILDDQLWRYLNLKHAKIILAKHAKNSDTLDFSSDSIPSIVSTIG